MISYNGMKRDEGILLMFRSRHGRRAKRYACAGASSPGSSYSAQEIISSCGNHSHGTNEISRHLTTEDFRSLERRLEREREKRTGFGLNSSNNKMESKSYRGDKSPVDYLPCKVATNGFRPAPGRGGVAVGGSYFQREVRTHSNSDSLVATGTGAGTLAFTPPAPNSSLPQSSSGRNSSGGLRSHPPTSITITSKDIRLRTPPPVRVKSKATSISSMSPMPLERIKTAKYADPVSGAPQSFTNRLSELSSLEYDTIRYERNKKLKKKAKQDRD